MAEASLDRVAQRRAEQLLESYRQLPVSLLVNLVNGVILSAVLWSEVSAVRIVFWLALILLVTALRYGLFRAYVRREGGGNGQAWAMGFRAGACGAGLSWGLAGVVLFPGESVYHQVFLAFMIGGMAAGAVPLLSALKGAYPCFAFPTLVPISLRIMLDTDEMHLMMGMMCLVFGTAMLFASRQIHRAVSESIDLRLQLADSHAHGERLARMANSDALTGIANRRSFDEALEKEWRRAMRNGSALSLILADIDHFKAYNDRYGHAAGDQCLRDVARALVQVIHRPADLVARVGGEEFAVLLPETPLIGASKIAEDIRRAVSALEIEHGASAADGAVTLSLGVATLVPQEALTPALLFEWADQALYRAKHQGRNRVGLHWGSTPARSTPEPIAARADAVAPAEDRQPGRRTG